MSRVGATARGHAHSLTLAGVLGCMASGCVLPADVVARPDAQNEQPVEESPSEEEPLVDAGARAAAQDSGVKRGRQDGAVRSAPATALPCTAQGDDTLVITKPGKIFRYDAATRAVTDLGTPACLSNGYPDGAALDEFGVLWLSWAGVLWNIEPDSLACRQVAKTGSIRGMAFADVAGETMLFGLQGDRLVRVDPATRILSDVSRLDADLLVGDPKAALFALRQEDDATITLLEIFASSADAGQERASATLPRWGLVGARREGGSFELFSPTNIFRFDPARAQVEDLGLISKPELGVATVAAQSCGSRE